MKNPFDYSISLRVTHPTLTQDQISMIFDMTPQFGWTAGEARTTLRGRSIGGIRSESYCSFDIHDGDDGEVTTTIRATLKKLEVGKPEFQKVRASGGRISFYVFWYPNGDTGEIFDYALLTEMVDMGIELDLNVLDLRDVEAS